MTGNSVSEGKDWIAKILSRILLDHSIKRVLDVGAGRGNYSDLFRSKYGREWVAIEAWEPYIHQFRLGEKYDLVINHDVRKLIYDDNERQSYTVAFAGDVLEHMTKEEALVLYDKLLKIADFVIFSIPIIHFPQDEVEGNPYERHVKDDWTHKEVMDSFPNILENYVGQIVGCYVASTFHTQIPTPRLKIGIYAIAKNEEKFVKPFLESCKGADYVLIADTGSTDNTVDVAQELLLANGLVGSVQTILVKPWRFDVARNLSLALLPGWIDICICLDMDEVLVGNWRQRLLESWVPGTTRLRYPYTWSWVSPGVPDLIYMADKIHARTGYLWHHPVHETMRYYGSGVEVWSESTMEIHHFPDSSKSRGQYLPLLELAVREDPDDDRNAHYLGREYVFSGMWDKAIAELNRHLKLPRSTWDAERAASYRYLAQCYRALGNEQMALVNLRKAVEECPYMREPWMDMAQHYYNTQQWSFCYIACKEALKIVGRPKVYLTNALYYGGYPYDLLGVAAWHVGLLDEAIEATAMALQHDPTDKRLQGNLTFYLTEKRSRNLVA